MNLYKISQDQNNSYNTYDSAVVAAETVRDASMIHPSQEDWDGKDPDWSDWVAVEDVKVELIGKAEESIDRGIIVSSFNAG
ncbi:hypothetical protein LCGC14_2587470 [marine sediment metagenome]|uniref:Uncharacterized protein n=1 Tax=marine sediment metagenome TaxID=412755 RepID=A0A0F9AD20_9ZZZZ